MAVVCKLSEALRTALDESKLPSLGTITARAVGDVRRIAIYLLSIVGEGPVCENAADAVQEVRAAKTGSSPFHFKFHTRSVQGNHPSSGVGHAERDQ